MIEMKFLFVLLLVLPQDGEERRKAFLAGDSAREASALVLTLKEKNIDTVAAFFVNREKPYAGRLTALKALRLLKKPAPKEYKRVYKTVQTHLSLEASRGHGMSSLKKNEVEMLLHALEWHTDMKYEHAMYVLEHYVDTDINRLKRNKLPDRVREAAARLLGRYPESSSSRDTLWETLAERTEPDPLRQLCYDSLKPHMKNRREEVLRLKADRRDVWLLKFQQKLLEKP